MRITAVHQQDEISVYLSQGGDVVVEQPDGMEEPGRVAIAPQNIEKVIRALRQVKREALAREARPNGD